MQTDSSHPGAAAGSGLQKGAACPNLRSQDLLIHKAFALVPVLCCRGYGEGVGAGAGPSGECSEEERGSLHTLLSTQTLEMRNRRREAFPTVLLICAGVH